MRSHDCPHHHRGNYPRGWRLILARLHHDDHAHQLIADEIGECAGCWREIAEDLATRVTDDLVIRGGHDWGQLVAWVEDVIAGALDACAADERDLNG